ncbi:hypothetical protein NR756_04655 [Alloalcanivorax xenomutans]|uniref:hypothetical protein n=1 Tax=Alloalcanivorax xenomutans TaxID=1094342 RepID=UPI003A7FD265
MEELETWLLSRYGEAVLDDTDALTYFQSLAPEQQRIFLREVYYAELREGGREFNEMDGWPPLRQLSAWPPHDRDAVAGGGQ